MVKEKNLVSKTLIFIRNHQSMNQTVIDFAKKHLKCKSYITISEYQNADIYIDLHQDKSVHEESYNSIYEILSNTPEIITRDRVLRNLPYGDAVELLNRTAKFFEDLFFNHKPECIVTYPVDNYVMDIMVRVAKRKGVKVHGVCNFFVPNLKRITVYGEHNSIRKVEKKETLDLIGFIQGKFRSPMALRKSEAIKKAIIDYFKYKIRWIIYYFLYYKLMRKLNYDYMGTVRMSAVRLLSNFCCLRYFSGKLPSKGVKAILLPLHYHPEATLEYWSPDLTASDFQNSLRMQLYKLLDQGFTVYLKEHPAMVFRNPLVFYKSISKEFGCNVKWLDPFISNADLFKNFGTVFAWTGSSGIEALINGKKVIFGSNNYYLEANNIDKQEVQLQSCEVESFIENILSGTIRTGSE